MKKLYTIISIMLLTMLAAVAQAPERFSYQAVIRNANNSLVANANVGVRVSILQGGATGNSVYTETHTAGTNANGLLTVEIGGGNAQQGSFQSIDWGSGSYFLKTEVDPNGGSNYSITSVQQLMSVPYALYAREAANGFSGDYNDLTNLPQIPQIPADISAFNNDAGYLTGYTETDPQFNAWDKDYNDLINKPAIQAVPTNVSAFTNDAGYITAANVQEAANIPTNVSAFNNDAGYITSEDIPEIPTVPTNVSAFTNDAHYITDVQLQQIMNTIASMQNTIDSMGLMMEVLYNQLNQSDSIPAGIDTGLQVTFTTSGYTNEPAVKYSDVSQAGFFQTPSSSTGLTGNINDWWIWESNRTKNQPTSYVYANKPFSSIEVRRWSLSSWIVPETAPYFTITTSGNTTTVELVHYHSVNESFDRERAVYAIKFNE